MGFASILILKAFQDKLFLIHRNFTNNYVDKTLLNELKSFALKNSLFKVARNGSEV